MAEEVMVVGEYDPDKIEFEVNGEAVLVWSEYGNATESARKAKGWTRAELGSLVDRSVQAVYLWERRGVLPHPSVRRRLKELLGVKPPG